MAIVSYIKEKKQTVSAMKGVIDYCAQRQKVYDPGSDRELISGIHCQGQNAFLEFMATKQAYKKVSGIHFYQYVQSFSPLENITPEKAHEIALEFAAQAWPGHEVQVTTHCDADHLHSHFVINSVSFETGRKLRQDPQTLEQLRSLSDSICQKHGLSILPPRKQDGVKLSAREYRAAAKGESWKFRLMGDIEFAMQHSGSQEDFIFLLKKRGYSITWTQERKYITFTCPNGKKCRDIKLHHEKYLKENLEYELSIREQLTEQILSGELDPEELSDYGELRVGTLRADHLRHTGEPAEAGDGTAAAGSGIPTHPVPPDRSTGDSGATGGTSENYGTDGAAPAPKAAVGEQGHSRKSETFHLTGWEESREHYFRALRTAGQEPGRDQFTGYQFAPEDRPAAGNHIGAVRPGVRAGLRDLADLGDLIEDDSEDEEQRKNRIQAQQAGSDLGLALGLAIGAAEALTKGQNTQEEVTEENKWQQIM